MSRDLVSVPEAATETVRVLGNIVQDALHMSQESNDDESATRIDVYGRAESKPMRHEKIEYRMTASSINISVRSKAIGAPDLERLRTPHWLSQIPHVLNFITKADFPMTRAVTTTVGTSSPPSTRT